MSIKNIVLISITLIFIGCSSHTNRFTPFISSKINLDKNRDKIIIHDFITIIKTYYPPATTIFQIKQTNTEFAKKIENSLRQRGYGLGAIYTDDIKRVPLAWKITYLTKKLIRVSYYIGDASVSRVYQLKYNLYQPYSSFSAIGLDSRKFANINFSMDNTYQQPTILEATVTASSLKIRSKPTVKSKTLAIKKRGEHVYYKEIVLDNNNQEWAKLEGGGYMKASYLKL